jgi:hypothetical protein
MKEKIVVNEGLSFHGECAIVRAELVGITELPKDAKMVEPDNQGRLLVAHSESGHHHYVDSDQAVLYKTDNPLIKFLQVEIDTHALLKHAKPMGEKDRHSTQDLGPGLYKIINQREKTPEGWRQVAD